MAELMSVAESAARCRRPARRFDVRTKNAPPARSTGGR